MFGKLIAPDGSFRGFVRGLWNPSDDSPGHGAFRAQWLDAEREEIGGMRGVWERRRDGRGFFHGAWATSCGGQAEEGDVDIDPSVFGE